jgi:glycoside/pentoside/hexuronide:cation symporter, GPH family
LDDRIDQMEAVQSPLAAVPQNTRRVSVSVLYGIGEMPVTISMVLFGLFTLFFYTTVMGLPGSLVGIAVAAGLVIDAFLDPYIGYRSDCSHHRLGRRHSYMLPAGIAVGPCFFLLFSPPRGLSQAAVFVWLFVSWVAVRFTSALYRIPYLSLGAELSSDYYERTRIFAIRALFGLVGALAAAGLSFLVFGSKTGGIDPKLNYASYQKLGLLFGAMMSVTALLCTLGTLRYRHNGTADRAPQLPARFLSGFLTSMRNRAFRAVWLYFVVFFLAVVLNASLAVHYFTWYAQIHGASSLSAIQAGFYIGALAGVFLWIALARRSEKRSLSVAATLGTALLLCLATLLVGEGRLFGTGNALPLILGHFVAGAIASAVWIIPASMVADVTDEDELDTGLRREGIYFGILNLGEKVASGGALLLAGLLLSIFGRLAPAASSQAPAAAPYIGVAYGLVPGVLLLGATLAILPYRLNRASLRAIQERLAARRSAGAPDVSMG